MGLNDRGRLRAIRDHAAALLNAQSLWTKDDKVPLPFDPSEPLTDDQEKEAPDPNRGTVEISTSHIVVGKGEGKPGDEVIIEVVGQTHREVQGFGLAIGCDPLLPCIRHDVAEELSLLLDMPNPQVIFKQQRLGKGWQGDFLQVAVIFFKTFLSLSSFDTPLITEPADLPIEPPRPKRGVASLQIPTPIPIFRLTFEIPQGAKPGMKFNLIPGFKYGRRLTFHDGNSRWLYYPTEYAGRPLIRPELTSGWIDVI